MADKPEVPLINPGNDPSSMPTSADERSEMRNKRHRQMHQDMRRSIVTEPLFSRVRDHHTDEQFEVIISLNELYVHGMAAALKDAYARLAEVGVGPEHQKSTAHYIFVCMTGGQILKLAGALRLVPPPARSIYRIWEDTELAVTLTRSLTTIKADAAQRAFRALGRDIVWAVLDSGVEGKHPHFAGGTLKVDLPLSHMDFTPANTGGDTDGFGHGSHVAGIIGGQWQSANPDGEMVAATEILDEQSGQGMAQLESVSEISSVAPLCKIVSLKVIADDTRKDIKQTAGQGKVSWVLLAIDQIQQWNQNGRRLLIHGVNMSLGYDFDPRWFACGQSPICVEVNRLVKCGVSVVVSAGNSGYTAFVTASGRAEARYNDLTITDPGNAELAITVGATHRDMPHLYGVSYFSSRGPTGDGRPKPDLVAPGERILSCAAGAELGKYPNLGDNILYVEQTGTSMAAPHVSGAIAAFLSVRREFIGQPERVKEILLANAIDLRREPAFQGAGLLDLMKVLQAV